MTDPIHSLFEQFVSGRMQLPDLQAAITRELQTNPASAQTVRAIVEQLFKAGRLPVEVRMMLLAQLPGNPDATRFKQTPASAPPGASSAVPEKTPAQPPDSDPNNTSGATKMPPQGTIATSRPQAPPDISGRPTTEGSNWDQPDQWTTTSTDPITTNSVLKGRLVIDELLGEGGMGRVFRARDQLYVEADDSNPYVAVKVLSDQFKRHPQALVALQREARKAQSLAHPNIITVHNFDRDGQNVFMTMELLEGQPLDKFIRKNPKGIGVKHALPIIEGIAAALEYAHQKNIIHSDLKPSNIFLCSDGSVKVLDFGIARAARGIDGNDTRTRFDAADLGALTPAYASPEMLLDLEPDPEDDIYALACVTYELLSGRHPFDGIPAHRAQHMQAKIKDVKGLSRRQMQALRHGLDFTRANRTSTVREFMSEFRSDAQTHSTGTMATIAVLSVVGVASAIGGYFWVTRCDRQDQLFLESLAPSIPAPSNPPRSEDLQNYLVVANTYLGMAQDTFDMGLLSESPSSAFGSFSEVLKIDPENAQARDGVMKILALYGAESERLLSLGQPQEAATVAATGLNLHPGSCSLGRLKARADKELQGG